MTRSHEAPLTAASVEEVLAYVAAQVSAQHLRHETMPQFPWPDTHNPMLRYLVGQAVEISASAGLDTALVWLAVHAWFEGALDAASGARRTGGTVATETQS